MKNTNIQNKLNQLKAVNEKILKKVCYNKEIINVNDIYFILTEEKIENGSKFKIKELTKSNFETIEKQFQLNQLKIRNEEAFKETRLNNSISDDDGIYLVNEDGYLRDLTKSEFNRFKEQFEYIEYNLKPQKVWVDSDVNLAGTTLDRLVKSNKGVI